MNQAEKKVIYELSKKIVKSVAELGVIVTGGGEKTKQLGVFRTEPKNGYFGQIMKPVYHSFGISRSYK